MALDKKTYDKAYYEANKAAYSARSLKSKKKAVARNQSFVNQIKSVPCMDCGGRFPPCAMDFDHRDPDVKTFTIGNAVAMGWRIERILEEVLKCDIVCANCHRIRTFDCGDYEGEWE